jgi:predicted DNA-binding protein with PD1-like motif
MLLIQGELEHCTPKARYKRTDKKTFVKQLERRESCLCRIREKLSSEGRLASEPVPRTPQEHHHICVSEKHHENISHFLRKMKVTRLCRSKLHKIIMFSVLTVRF